MAVVRSIAVIVPWVGPKRLAYQRDLRVGEGRQLLVRRGSGG